jgi:hypothetical protein
MNMDIVRGSDLPQEFVSYTDIAPQADINRLASHFCCMSPD